MGWEAYTNVRVYYGTNTPFRSEIKKDLKEIKKFVIEKAGSIDGGLVEGIGLCVSYSGKMLEKGTGINVYRSEVVEFEELKEISKNVNWDFEYIKKDACYYWSARKFFELCLKYELDIRFSY